MLYREIMAVRSEIHTKQINTLCGQNVEFVNVKLVVHIWTTEASRDKYTGSHTPFPPLVFVVQCLIKHRDTFTFTHDLECASFNTSLRSNGYRTFVRASRG